MSTRRKTIVGLISAAMFAVMNYGFAAPADAHASSLDPPAAGEKPAAKPKDPALIDVADVAGLPRVLLIGDSISIGYTLPARALLKDRANVHRANGNCGDTARGLRDLDKWLGTGKWDVIHFNFGLHDLKYLDEKGQYVPPEKGKQVAPLPQYEENLRQLVKRLQKTGAKLVFATTTPVPAGSLGRVEHDELRYNEVATRVMKENGITIDDLNALVTAKQAQLQRPKNVHFTPAGYDELAAQVVASITQALPAPAKP
jgi:acyl-CoA thioesterase-1